MGREAPRSTWERQGWEREKQHRLAFVLGQTLGNAVFASNLRSVVEDDADVAASWYFVDYPRWAGVRTPGRATAAEPAASQPRRRPAKSLVRLALGSRRQYELWAAWASTVALDRLAADLLYRRHDAVFFHTGSSALFAGPGIPAAVWSCLWTETHRCGGGTARHGRGSPPATSPPTPPPAPAGTCDGDIPDAVSASGRQTRSCRITEQIRIESAWFRPAST